MTDAVIQHEDGRVELRSDEGIRTSPLYNQDLAPVPVAQRNWTTYNYAALWISMAHCIPTYMLSSGLIGAGMNWWQALITILLGNTIVLIPILLNSHPGTKYGIPFPVFARASYGTYRLEPAGADARHRRLRLVRHSGLDRRRGAAHVLHLDHPVAGRRSSADRSADIRPTEWISFLLFWALNILIIYRGMDLLRRFENWAAPFVLVMTALLLGWAVWRAHGLGYLLHEKGKFETWAQFRPIFIPSLTAMIGFWATLSLNMPDFTRFGRSQREQAIGQTVALPTTMTVFAAMGVIITSAALVIYPTMSDERAVGSGQARRPVQAAAGRRDLDVHRRRRHALGQHRRERRLAGERLRQRLPEVDLVPHRRPDHRHRSASLMQPWRLLADPSGYIFTWLLGYSGGLGSIAGVMIVDYWIVRKKQLVLGDLYRTDGVVPLHRRLELARRLRHAPRLRRRLDRTGRPVAAPAVRLRLVRRLRRRRDHASRC